MTQVRRRTLFWAHVAFFVSLCTAAVVLPDFPLPLVFLAAVVETIVVCALLTMSFPQRTQTGPVQTDDETVK